MSSLVEVLPLERPGFFPGDAGGRVVPVVDGVALDGAAPADPAGATDPADSAGASVAAGTMGPVEGAVPAPGATTEAASVGIAEG
jgi:hypothetical protein